MNVFLMWLITYVLAHYYAAGYHAGYTAAMSDQRRIMDESIAAMEARK